VPRRGKRSVQTGKLKKRFSDILFVSEDRVNPSDESEALANGISNLEYHYLGSAKIPGQMGKVFAEAIVEIGRKSIR